MPLRITPLVNNTHYHLYNRGSEKRTIFKAPRDYEKFTTRFIKNSVKYGCKILVYILMPNHFHFLVRQEGENGIQKFMHATQLGHAKYFNLKNMRVGPLFQGRFKAKIIESDEYLLQVSAYIHKNIIPKSDSGNMAYSRNLMRNYPYSSYKYYLGKQSGFTDTETILSYFSKNNPNLSYESFVENFIPDIEELSPWILDQE